MSSVNRKTLAVVALIAVLLVSAVIAGILLNTQTETHEPENAAPSISILSPIGGQVLSGNVTIHVNVTDEEALTARILIDGSTIAIANIYEWDTSGFPDGEHTIRVLVTDSEGLSAQTSMQVTTENFEETPHPFDPFINVMLYNIKESGENPDWLQVVKDVNPDIAVFVETGDWDNNSNESLNSVLTNLNRYFANETPYDGYCTQHVYWSTSGEAIISRFRIKNFTQLGVLTLDDNSTYDVTHDFLYAVLDINGTDVHVFSAHLKAGPGSRDMERREREAEGILNFMDGLGRVPIIYLGDQNCFSPTDTGDLAPEGDNLGDGPMRMFLMPHDPTYGRFASEVHNFTDVFRTLNPGDPGYTYGHQESGTACRIDFILVNSFFTDMLINCTCDDTPTSSTGSDHYQVNMFLFWNASSLLMNSTDSSTPMLLLNPIVLSNTAAGMMGVPSRGEHVQSSPQYNAVMSTPVSVRRRTQSD